MLKLFRDLEINTITDKVIILDIDGTLLPDGTQDIDEGTLHAIKQCAQTNTIYLLSNKKVDGRNHFISKVTGLTYLDTPYKKPNPEIEKVIPAHEGKDVVVIGDKWLTDGLFAKNIGAQFIKVKRFVGNDGWIIATINKLDDIAYLVHNLFYR